MADYPLQLPDPFPYEPMDFYRPLVNKILLGYKAFMDYFGACGVFNEFRTPSEEIRWGMSKSKQTFRSILACPSTAYSCTMLYDSFRICQSQSKSESIQTFNSFTKARRHRRDQSRKSKK